MDIKIIPKGVDDSSIPGSFSSAPQFLLAVSNKDASPVEGTASPSPDGPKVLVYPKGSVLSNPNEGTILGSAAGTNNTLDSASAALLLESSIADVEDQIKEYQAGLYRVPPSETLRSITVQSIVVGTSSVNATVVISNSLGESSLLEVGT